MRPADRNRAFLILFIGVLAASTGAIFVRLAQGEGIRSIEIAAYRLLFSVAILTPIVLIKFRQAFLPVSKSILLWCILAGFILSLHFASWITSLEYTTIASSVVLVTTTPVWLGLFSVVFQREKLTTLFIYGLILSLAGGGIVALSEECQLSLAGLVCGQGTAQAASPLLGNLLALIGSWMAAGYLLIGKRVQKTISITPYITLVYGVAAVFLVAMSIVSGGQLLPRSMSAFMWLLGLAIFPQLIGHTSFNWSLKHFSPTYVSIALLAEPIGSTILGIFIFKEIPSILKIGGALFILAGILIVSLNQSRIAEPSPGLEGHLP